RYLDGKLRIIPPPVALPAAVPEVTRAFRQKHGVDGRPVIGIICRLAAEKGVEVLLKALPLVQRAHPDAIVLHAGQTENVIGEEAYAAKLKPLFERHKTAYRLLGNIEGAELTAFYQSLDCLCVPSLNSTESFGLVQIEAMRSGVPVAACSLPGVRQPVTMTGMGEVTAVGDHEALAAAISRILDDRAAYQRPADLIAASFAPAETAAQYAALFAELLGGQAPAGTPEPAAYERLRRMRDGVGNKGSK
ncbi:MAG: glycosyltransferase family 4 protein, partial [Anaerolineales bacterium]|nr:glycosyltransferase family 4 protein [Anaerolineales bacterium]